MLSDSVGRDEYIDQKHGRFRKIKAAGVRSRRLTGTGFGGLFTHIENTEFCVPHRQQPDGWAPLVPGTFVSGFFDRLNTDPTISLARPGSVSALVSRRRSGRHHSRPGRG